MAEDWSQYEVKAPSDSENWSKYETKETSSHPILDKLKSIIPKPSPGMEKQFDEFLKREEAAGKNPAEHPAVMAIGGIINNIGEGLKNPQAVANALQDVTTLGLGSHATVPINAAINKNLWGEGGDTSATEKERQAKLSADNPYLPAVIGLPLGQAQSMIPTKGIVPEYIGKPVGDQIQKLTDLLDRAKGMRALKAAGSRAAEVTPAELEGAGGMLEKGKAAYDEGIIGPFSSKSTMRLRAIDAAKEGGSKMGALLDEAGKGGAIIDPSELKAMAQNRIGGFDPLMELAAPEAKALNKVTQAIDIAGAKGPMTPAEAQELKGVFDKYARWERPGQLPENQVLADTLRQASGVTRGAIDQSVSQSLGPQALGALNEARLQHGTGHEFSDLFNRAAGQENAGAAGISVEPVTKSLLKPVARKWSQAIGYGEHVASDITRGLTNVIQNSPQMLGKYAPQLQAAAVRGPAAIASTNFVLNQKDPEYREKMRQINDQEGQ